jgi:hypothetical protein
MEPRAPAAAEPSATEPGRERRSWIGWLVVAVVAVALVVGIAMIAATGGGPSAVELVAPARTADRLDAGESVEAIPTVVHLEPGQALELDNRDSRLHVIGTLRAAAGDRARQVFDSEGRYVVRTSLRSDGLVTILVEDPDSS